MCSLFSVLLNFAKSLFLKIKKWENETTWKRSENNLKRSKNDLKRSKNDLKTILKMILKMI